jgi:teichuronic acid biosynthesis glycosyltransferase TuaG
MIENKVSIVMPAYNSSAFLTESIQSVINQTYTNWELIIIDDCSKDNSVEIIKSFCLKDNRIKLLETKHNSGSPTLPRNIGIETAEGRFLAFLDSDDLWESDKLDSQLKLFEDKFVAIAFSNYEKINEKGLSSDRKIIAPLSVNYNQLLNGNVIGCCTCVIDIKKVGKNYFFNQGHEDYALWLSILRKGFIARNSGLISAKYRVRNSSVSSNKFKTILWVYNIYRKNENLSYINSIYYTLITLFKAFIKYLK